MSTGIRKTKGSSKVAGGAAVDNGRRCHVLEYCRCASTSATVPLDIDITPTSSHGTTPP